MRPIKPLIACSLALLLAACAPPPRDPNYNPAVDPVAGSIKGWADMHAALKALPDKDQAQILFLGDSITAGWAGAGKQIWSANFETLESVNLGVPADRTEHVLYRIADGALDGYDPKVVVLMIGTNNLKSGEVRMAPDRTAAGVQAVIEAIQAKLPKARVLLLGILPRQPKYDWIAQSIKLTNEQLSKLADGNRVRYRDCSHVFVDAGGKLKASCYAKDMLHLSETGYREMAAIIVNTIRPMLKMR